MSSILSAAAISIAAAFTLSCITSRAADPGDVTLKQQIVVQAQGTNVDDYSFRRTSRVEQVGIGETEKRVIVEQFDPAKPANLRWALVFVDGHPPVSSDAKAYNNASSSRKVPSYAKVAEYFATGTRTQSTESPEKVTYHFDRLPKGTVIIAGTDVSSTSSGDAVVNTDATVPFVEQVRFTMAQPTRIKLVARLERFESTTRYRLLPNGKPVLAEQTIEITGSMLGKQGRIHTSIAYTDVAAVSR